MRVNLKVPFTEKDAAKKLGARWDAARKIWYVEGDGDLSAFAQWSPTAHAAADEVTAPKAPAKTAKVQQASGKPLVGRHCRELPVICHCLPWEVCDQCRATALNS